MINPKAKDLQELAAQMILEGSQELANTIISLANENKQLRQAIIDEREACASIADQHSAPLVAAKIRARGNP